MSASFVVLRAAMLRKRSETDCEPWSVVDWTALVWIAVDARIVQVWIAVDVRNDMDGNGLFWHEDRTGLRCAVLERCRGPFCHELNRIVTERMRVLVWMATACCDADRDAIRSAVAWSERQSRSVMNRFDLVPKGGSRMKLEDVEEKVDDILGQLEEAADNCGHAEDGADDASSSFGDVARGAKDAKDGISDAREMLKQLMKDMRASAVERRERVWIVIRTVTRQDTDEKDVHAIYATRPEKLPEDVSYGCGCCRVKYSLEEHELRLVGGGD